MAESQPARELVAAMGETRQVRGAMEILLSLFRPTSQGWVARTSGGRLRRLAESAGVTPPDVTTNYGDVADEADELREQLAARTTQLATVLGEFSKGSDGCHARVSQVTLAKRMRDAGMEITDAERKMIGG
jgi:hypothetical protein